MSAIDVSILIVNWNTRDHVVKCLDALPVGIDDDLACEVIVVDNGSVDGSADALDREDIELIRNSANLGFAAAVNQAYARSTGEFILLLNSDVELMTGALSTLVRFLRRDPGAAGAAPLYLNPDGSPQPFHFRIPTFTTMLVNGSAVARWLLPGSGRRLREYTMADEDFSEALPVPQPSASCLLLRRSFLPEGHIFDESYPIFFNDVQLARSFADQGLTLWVTPDASVVHEAHASTGMLGRGPGSRQYLGSLIRMLRETEPSANVWVYRIVVFLGHIPKWMVGHSRALGVRDLWKALSGDVGSLPSVPGSMSTKDARPQLESQRTSRR